MKRSTTTLLAALVVLAASPALAVDVVVQASGSWGKKHDVAVNRAGGSVVWKHDKTGIALLRSEAPSFYAAVAKSKAFKYAARDVEIDWQPDVKVAELAVDPSDDTFVPYQWVHEAIDTQGAWDAGCEGAGVRVAVIDGGVYDAHVDLAGQIDTSCSTSFYPGQAYNADTGTFWHGTHVTGIVAAADNDLGVLGIAPGAEILALKALHNGTGSFNYVIGAILYASDPAGFGRPDCAQADIINLSLGAVDLKRYATSRGEGASLMGVMGAVMNYANARGVLTVSAASNEGIDVRDYPDIFVAPAMFGAGIAVSATGPENWYNGATDYDVLASYSNYGDGFIWVSAPGGDFRYPGNEECEPGYPCWVFDMYLSTTRGSSAAGSYSWAAGTSMAAPAAAGVAALIKGVNPLMTPGDVKELLKDSAIDAGPIGHDPFHGHGWVNAGQACAAAKAWLPPLE